jgi:hypothetical protein
VREESMATTTIQPIQISTKEFDDVKKMTSPKRVGTRVEGAIGEHGNVYRLIDHRDGLAHFNDVLGKAVTEPFNIEDGTSFFVVDSDKNGVDEIYVRTSNGLNGRRGIDAAYAFDLSSLYDKGTSGWQLMPSIKLPYDFDTDFDGEGCFGTDHIFDDDPLQMYVTGGAIYIKEADNKNYSFRLSPEMVLQKSDIEHSYYRGRDRELPNTVDKMLVCASLSTADVQRWPQMRSAVWMFRNSQRASLSTVQGPYTFETTNLGFEHKGADIRISSMPREDGQPISGVKIEVNPSGLFNKRYSFVVNSMGMVYKNTKHHDTRLYDMKALDSSQKEFVLEALNAHKDLWKWKGFEVNIQRLDLLIRIIGSYETPDWVVE